MQRIQFGGVLAVVLMAAGPAGVDAGISMSNATVVGPTTLSGPPDVVLRFDPSGSTVQLNDTFTVDVYADLNVPVVGWGLDLLLGDAAVASLVNAVVNGLEFSAAPTNDGDGLAGLAFPDPVVGPDILLATLTMQADQVGVTSLALGVTPGDLSEGFALDAGGFGVIAVEEGEITVVPEPQALLLVSFALAIIGRRSRA